MRRGIHLAVVGVLLLGAVVAWTAKAQTAISADGVVESTTGGFQFPDGTLQVTAAAGGAPVEDTGQTACFAEDGVSRDCTGTGEDGELQAGVTWPTPRFTDNGDGTVTDRLTDLIWLKDADCPGGIKTWQEALDWVADLNDIGMAITCTDYAANTFTDWRLPNVKELPSLIDYDATAPALPTGHPFVNVVSFFYWSSTTFLALPGDAWAVSLASGSIADPFKTNSYSVWAVRGGQ